MNNLTDLKVLWHSADTRNLPSSAEMVQVVRRFRAQRLKKKWKLISFSIGLTALMILVTFYESGHFLTTYIGGSLIAGVGFYLAASNLFSLKRFHQLDDSSNKEFLKFLEQTRLNQVRYYRKVQGVMMLICSVGLLLYLYEQATRHLLYSVLLLAITIAFLLINWMLIRPKIFRRDQQKLEELRIRMLKIMEQLNQSSADEN